jgi:hypothetical protein
MNDESKSQAKTTAPRLSAEQRDKLLVLLASGLTEKPIADFFGLLGWEPLAGSSLSHYRKKWKAKIEAASAARIDEALTTGLALKANRIAALKEHAAQLEQIKFAKDKNGRLWNERAWRQTLEDIALEMGDRKPKDAPQEQLVKVYVGLDPDQV